MEKAESDETQTNANASLVASLAAIQQKLANEREKLNRPSSEESTNDETNIKLQQAMLRRQELLDKIRNEQLADVERPRTYSPRRRYTPSPLPPPSRRSLPDLGRAYHFNWYNKPDPQIISVPKADMAQTKHVIEHQFKHADPPTQRPVVLPPIQSVQPAIQTIQAPPAVHLSAPAPTVVQAPAPQQIAIAQPQPVIQQVPSFTYLDGGYKVKDTMFNKSDFMDMMMLQNAQMHHMVMQQMMLQNLPGSCGGGSCKLPTAQVPLAPVMAEATAVRAAPVYSSPPVVHHYQSMPAMEMRGPPMGRVVRRPHRTNIAPIVVRTDVNKGNRPSSVFLFGIILKEIVAALHRVYLNPNGNIYPVLGDVIGQGAADFTLLAGDPRGRIPDGDRVKMFQVLQYVMENLIYHITEIMPKTGVLGTHKKSAVFEMIKNGKRFPDGYFWQIELDRLQFNSNGRTINVGDNEAFLLMVGMFLSRSLITTLLMKPVDYGLSTDPLTDVAERNLKVLATIMLFLVRRVSTPRDAPMMPMPGEVARYVFSDEEMRNVHLRLRRSYEYCENLLREWGTEYIKRLREAATVAHKTTV